MLHKYNGPSHNSCGEITGVWSRCGERVLPWEARYKWKDVDCEACREHPDYGISLAKKRKSVKGDHNECADVRSRPAVRC